MQWKALFKGVHPPTFLEQSTKLKVRRRRRRRGGEWGESILLLSWLETLGECHELPQRGPGRSPGEKRIWCILSVTEPFWLQDIVNIIKMQNDTNIQLPLIFQKTFSGFFVAFASIRFIRFKLLWRYLLFIVTYSCVGIARNWSHKRQTSPQGQESKNRGGLLGEKPVAGSQPRKQTVYGAWRLPKNAYIEYNFC